jgi:hypothetical protein
VQEARAEVGAVQGDDGAATSGAAAVQFWVQEVLGAAHVAWGFYEVNLVGLGSQPIRLKL